mgnify:CR=1 FL=1
MLTLVCVRLVFVSSPVAQEMVAPTNKPTTNPAIAIENSSNLLSISDAETPSMNVPEGALISAPDGALISAPNGATTPDYESEVEGMKIGDEGDELESLCGSPNTKGLGMKLLTDKRGGHNSKNGPATWKVAFSYKLADGEEFPASWQECSGELLAKVQEFTVRARTGRG